MKTQIKNHEVIGIDLGTRNCVVSFCDENGIPKVIPDADGNPLKQSTVFIDSDWNEVLVGSVAEHAKILEPMNVQEYFKRDVGTETIYRTAGGKDVTPVVLQAEQLKAIRKDVADYCGDPKAGSYATITVPAYFGEKERQSVTTSAQQAGFAQISLISEPTAAAMAYGFHNKQGDRNLCVIDWGGGTFDCSILYLSTGECTVLSTHGDKKLGGRDINDAILEVVIDEFKKKHGETLTRETHPEDWFSIEEEIERKKRQLSARTEVKLAIRASGKSLSLEFNRKQLGNLVRPLLERMEIIIKETLDRAKVKPEEITNVLLVGGSTRERTFKELIKLKFGEDKIHQGQTSPDLAVAEGAALEALRLASQNGSQVVSKSLKAIPTPMLKRNEAMPHSLGVKVLDSITLACNCSVILERDTAIPASEVKSYCSVSKTQESFLIQVLQGEEGQSFDDCLVVGEQLMKFPARDPESASIDVEMSYDPNGMVRVLVTDKVSSEKKDITVDYYAKFS